MQCRDQWQQLGFRLKPRPRVNFGLIMISSKHQNLDLTYDLFRDEGRACRGGDPCSRGVYGKRVSDKGGASGIGGRDICNRGGAMVVEVSINEQKEREI